MTPGFTRQGSHVRSMYRAPNKSNEINGLENFSKPFFFACMKKVRKTSEHFCIHRRTRMHRRGNFFHTPDLCLDEGPCAAIAVIDAAKFTNHLMAFLGRSSSRAGSLEGRSYLGEEGRRITCFTLPVCEDPNQIAFHAVASDVVRACPNFCVNGSDFS